MSKFSVSFKSDIVTVAAAATAVALGTGKAFKLRLKALAGNTGVVGVGDSDVASTNWYELAAGDELILDLTSEGTPGRILEFDLAQIFVDAATNGDKLSINYLRS